MCVTVNVYMRVEFHLRLRFFATYILEFIYKMEVLTVVTLRNTVFLGGIMLNISLVAFAVTEFSKLFSAIRPHQGVAIWLIKSQSMKCCRTFTRRRICLPKNILLNNVV